MYNVLKGHPISAWGELPIVTVQNAALVLLLWRYAVPSPSLATKLLVCSAAVAHVAISLVLPASYHYLLPALNLPFMIITRLAQVRTNVSNGHTGLLSFTSLLMNIATVLVRVFTTVVLVGWDWPILRAYSISVASNGVLLCQIIYYRASTARAMAAGKEEEGGEVDKKVR